MSNINSTFFEMFKRLDKLCREMYESEKGVTAYIDDMKLIPEYKYRGIINWENDLKNLIKLRHIRNKLSHDVGTFETDMCDEEDVDWLKDFYERILTGTDPLSLLRIKLKSTQQNIINTQNTYNSDVEYYVHPQHKHKKLPALVDFINIVLIILLCLVFAYVIFSRLR